MSLSHADTSPAEEQAALWAARSDGRKLTRTERAQLDYWLAESPGHPALLEQYRALSSYLEDRLPALTPSGADEPASAPLDVAQPAPGWSGRPAARPAPSNAERPTRNEEMWPKARASKRNRNWLVAAAFAGAAAVGLFALRPVFAHRVVTLETPAGQRRTVTLADGSRVEMNARTTLLVENGGKERRVRLADGEAFFVVAKDRSRPFTVVTPAGSVRVTGTIFDVCSESPTDFQVTVVEGSVQVRNAGSSLPITLTAGQRFEAGPGGSFGPRTLSASSLENVLAWRTGNIVFEGGATLREALGKFAHYHGYRVVVSPEASTLADLPRKIGGQYELDNLDVFLSDAEKLMQTLSVTQASDCIWVDLREKTKNESRL